MATIWAQITTIISAEISAGCVAAGIVWESAAPCTRRRRVSHRLVIWGVVAEVLFSLALFVSDEIVSGSQLIEIRAQQDKIVALETRLAPRVLKKEQLVAIANAILLFKRTSYDAAVSEDAEPRHLLGQILDILNAAHWERKPWEGSSGMAIYLEGKEGITASAITADMGDTNGSAFS
jgi:hypothetical protein